MKQDQGLGPSFLSNEDISPNAISWTCNKLQLKKKKLDYCRELHQQNFLKINKLRYTEVKSKVCVVILDLYFTSNVITVREGLNHQYSLPRKPLLGTLLSGYKCSNSGQRRQTAGVRGKGGYLHTSETDRCHKLSALL